MTIPIGFYGSVKVATVAWSSAPDNLNNGGTSQVIRQLASNDSGIVVSGSQNGRVSRSTDYAATFTALTQNLGTGATGQPCTLLVSDRGTNFIAGFNTGRITRSTDSGATWTTLPQYLGRVDFQPSQWTCGAWDPANNTVIVCGSTGKCFRSTDDGANWTSLSDYFGLTLTVPSDVRKIAHVGGTTWVCSFSVASGQRETAYSTDGGLTWTKTAVNGFGSNAAVYDIAGRDNHAVCTNAGHTGRRTTDGITWDAMPDDLDGAGDDFASEVLEAIASSGTGIYLTSDGTDNYFTTDSGVSWRHGPSLSSIGITTEGTLKCAYLGNNTFLTTFGGGKAGIAVVSP